MPWPRRFLGLPLHPMLVHVPLVCWACTPILDCLALSRSRLPWWELSLATTLAGVVVGAAAVLTGLLDYVFLSETGSSDVRLAARHGVRTGFVWCAMVVKSILVTLAPTGRSVVVGCLFADVLATAVLLQGMYLGTRIVYGHRQ